jgi:hypothetical protein
VWWDTCASILKARGAVGSQRSARLFDFRFAKSPDSDQCRSDSHSIGSVDSRSAQKAFAKKGRQGQCSCAQGGAACHKVGIAKSASVLLAAARSQDWPFLRFGTSSQIMADAGIMLNATVATNSRLRLWGP